jgi:hypothetical protein
MNHPFPVPLEVALCLAALAALVVISYLSHWVHAFMSRRFPQAPAPAEPEGQPREPAMVHVDGPMIMLPGNRPFIRAGEKAK